MNLILFFNGWGMDDSILKDINIPQGYILKVVNFPYNIDINKLNVYSDIVYIGWSFGCYYLTKFICKNNIISKNTIAINGNSQTIGKYGIPKKMFDLTLNTLTPETLVKFYENMGAPNFIPSRDFESIKSELQYFGDNFIPLKNIFKYIFIGENDRIIPTTKQKKLCEVENIFPTILPCEHYPFNDKDILINIIKRLNHEL